MKQIASVYRSPLPHWVGDGFPVRSLFTYARDATLISPFLLLDYAGPQAFLPTTARRGVGQHPHRGFETVTIVYQGELEHRDSTGAGGLIGAGDVQWMTAANGILHEEFHSPEFARTGGLLEMIQLWVNLPARDKRAAPGYQTLLNQDIPIVQLHDGAGSLRVIAGHYAGRQGPARTFTSMDVWDVRLNCAASLRLPVKAGRTCVLVVLRGSLQVNEQRDVEGPAAVMFEREGADILVMAREDVTLLLLSAEPVDEPIVGYGPFVMNTQAQIEEAFDDYRTGRFGELPSVHLPRTER